MLIKNKLYFKKFYSLSLLLFLYFSQGLPFGFQVTALPVYLRESGISLAIIGYSTALALPWLLKALWAPIVDSYWSSRFGRRRSWIVPLQVMMIISMLSAFYTCRMGIVPLFVNIFIMNLFAATQDIAVDGLAVDILREGELGLGNTAQVAGYKLGMIVSGGVLVWLSSVISWNYLFVIMGAVAALPLVLVFFLQEGDFAQEVTADRISIKKVAGIFFESVRYPAFRWLLFFVGTYKFGEILIDVMFKPFLIDSGIKSAEIGLWVGTWGMAASIAGSLAGGYLASKLHLFRALFTASVARLIPLIFITFLTLGIPSKNYIIASTLLEHFFGGMLTTALFAFMMWNSDKRIGATHYTILASIEVLGKMPGSFFSGIIAEKTGYTFTFIAGTLLSAAVIFILPLYKRSLLEEKL
ncbi:MAG TPA: MFS transporter [Spirochaetota bacterium]|nr:MFS transporter [Spirochaetota bacterium]HPJ35746.1 MFS transporter [Spirochaetota bacterium]